MNDKLLEITAFLCVTITGFAVIALIMTCNELSKAQEIYCLKNYSNNVLNYKHCTNTRFVKILQENNNERD